MAHLTTARSKRGFSVLEMLVAAGLMLVALSLASRLLLDAQASISNSGRRQLDMEVDLAFDQMRTDLHNSIEFAILPILDEGWINGEPLRLIGHASGDSIVYSLENGDLFRLVLKRGSTDVSARRLVLDRVVSFRWRSMPATPRPALQVEISHEETAPLLGRTAAGQREALDSVTRTVQLVAAPRVMDPGEPTLWW